MFSIDNSSGDIIIQLIDSQRRVIKQNDRINKLESDNSGLSTSLTNAKHENSDLSTSLTNAKHENSTLQSQIGFI